MGRKWLKKSTEEVSVVEETLCPIRLFLVHAEIRKGAVHGLACCSKGGIAARHTDKRPAFVRGELSLDILKGIARLVLRGGTVARREQANFPIGIRP